MKSCQYPTIMIWIVLWIHLLLSGHTIANAQNEAGKSAYDFNQLNNTLDADQVDYFSGAWSYTVPLPTIEGAGALPLPLALHYSSNVTGPDRLIKLSEYSRGTYTVNNAGWVGLGWNLNPGAITVNGGYNVPANGQIINHPFAFDMTMVLPDGSHRLVRQIGSDGQPAHTFFTERRQFWRIEWDYDPGFPLNSTWTARNRSGNVYTFGAVAIDNETFGANLTMRAGVVDFSLGNPPLDYVSPEFVYQWKLAEIRDALGNAIRIKYAADGPITTYRSTAAERDTSATGVARFYNHIETGDLDPRYAVTPGSVELIKTMKTAHLTEVRFTNASGQLVKRIITETSDATALPPPHVTIENLNNQNAGSLIQTTYFRNLDGLDTNHRLDALVVENGDSKQIMRIDFAYAFALKPPMSGTAGTGHSVLLLERVTIQGKDQEAALPSYRFDYSASDSYRLANITLPTGGVIGVEYEGYDQAYPPGNFGFNEVEADFYMHARRVRRRLSDADGAGPDPPAVIEYVYSPVDRWNVPDTPGHLELLAHAWVDQILPGAYGRIRRAFVGLEDLAYLAPFDEHDHAERRIRRGTLKSEIRYSEADEPVQSVTITTAVDTVGSWLGSWNWFAHPGIQPQSYWVRPVRRETVLDGVPASVTYEYDADNGLVNRETTGDRVAETVYHSDETTIPVPWSWVSATNDFVMNLVDYDIPTAQPPDGVNWASAEADAAGGGIKESEIVRTYLSSPWTVTQPLYRVIGVIGCDDVQAEDVYTGCDVTVWVDWSNGSKEQVAAFSRYFVPSSTGASPANGSDTFDVMVQSPEEYAGALTGTLRMQLHAYVWSPSQPVPRSIRAYAQNLSVEALAFPDFADVEYTQMRDPNIHILDRPRRVFTTDASGQLKQYTEFRYGPNFLPDTTIVWQDRNGNGQMLLEPEERLVLSQALTYDASGNPVEVMDANGTVTSTKWRYNGALPVGGAANALNAQIEVFVFDDYPDTDALLDDGWYLWTGGYGALDLVDGALTVEGDPVYPVDWGGSFYAAKYDMTPIQAGVLECEIMSEANQDEINFIAVYDGGDYAVLWEMGDDGQIYVYDGAARIPAGTPFEAHRWYSVRIQWDMGAENWFFRLDGVRYPSTGFFACGAGAANPGRIEFWNGPPEGALHIDDVRIYPVSALPLPMTTYDPVNNAVTSVRDENGGATFYERDGLGRVRHVRGPERRIVARRYDYFSRNGNGDAYTPADPNQAGIAVYPDPGGHILGSGDDDLLLQALEPVTGNIEEEARTITTLGQYDIEAEGDVTFLARDEILLQNGFHAHNGAGFLAALDPNAGNAVTTGAVAFNMRVDGETATLLDTPSTMTASTTGGHLTVRADVYPAASVSGLSQMIGLERDGHRFALWYTGDTAQFQITYAHPGGDSGAVVMPVTMPAARWYACELEMAPSGRCYAWVYEKEGDRNPNSRIVIDGYPDDWAPDVVCAGIDIPFYMADMYIGPAQVATSFLDGFAREIQTRTRTGIDDILTHVYYNAVSQPDSMVGPVSLSENYAFAENILPDGRRSVYTYQADPLLRSRMMIPPGHDASDAIRYRYGFWGQTGASIRRYETVQDEKGVATTRLFDQHERLIASVADSGGVMPETQNAVTSFGYDLFNRLRYATPPDGGTTRYGYDTLGNRISAFRPDADDTTRFAYDHDGNLRFSRNARQASAGQVTFYTYDTFNRVTIIGEADAAINTLNPELSYSFETQPDHWKTVNSYDVDYSGDGENYARGRLTRVVAYGSADSVAVTLAYNRQGLVRLHRVAIADLPEKTVRYEYDLNGRITKIVYPDNSAVRYEYDTAGRLSNITGGGQPYAAYTYTPAGNIATHTVGDNLVHGVFSYTLRDWLETIEYGSVFKDSLSYDGAGNVTGQQYQSPVLPAKMAHYDYDALHRLTGFSLTEYAPANPPFTSEGAWILTDLQDFEYDRNGNIIHRTTEPEAGPVELLVYNYSPESTPNRLDSASNGNTTTVYTYDPDGRTITRGVQELTYDYRGLVINYSDPGDSAVYLIDGSGNRVRKQATGAHAETIYYVRDIDGRILAEYDGAHTLLRKYVYAGTQRIAKIEADGAITYYLTDHLGNTRVMLADDGAIAAAYDYWPYGETLEQTGDETRFLFTGHERDKESELDYMLARMYTYEEGRLLQPDLLAEKYPHVSPYVYAADNPVKFVDPDGQDIYLVNTGDSTITQITTDWAYSDYYTVDGEGNWTMIAHLAERTTPNGILVEFPETMEALGIGRYGIREANGDHYASPDMAAALFGIAAVFHQGNPNVTVRFNNMSDQNGDRPTNLHSPNSHIGGINGDVRYIRTDNWNEPINLRTPGGQAVYDRERSQQLVDLSRRFGFGNIIADTQARLQGTSSLPRHYDHIHLQRFRLNATIIIGGGR